MNKYLTLTILLIMHSTSLAVERISNLVIPVSYFVNHVRQLEELKDNLNKYRQASIIGTSGIGKTQLVRTYAYDNKTTYNIIWFFDCNQDINIEFTKLAKQLNKNNISEDADLAKRDVMDYLVTQDKWLLVFDNLKIGENKKIQDLIDWEHNGNIIFCSQDGKILPNTIEMTLFVNSDAITLTTNLLNNPDKKDIKFLVEAFNGYPILIVQGTQLLNQVKGLGREEYKKKIYQSADKIKLNIELAMQELTPSAVQLLKKIALINNQAFSKQLLVIITDHPNTIDDDIFQLSKFVLISNIDSDQDNPVFEMHDVIAQKTIKINGYQDNKVYLEYIIDKITKAIPNNGKQPPEHTFRSGKTINENLKIITDYQQSYNLSIYKLLPLNLQLFINYINMFQFYEAEKLFNWFDELDKKEILKLWLMNNEEKLFYARYLGVIGGYYKIRLANWYKALEYSLRANQVLEKVEGYQAIKCNVLYNIASTRISLGQINEAQSEINAIEKNTNFIGLGQVTRIMKSKLYHYIGNEQQALEECDKEIMQISRSGTRLNDVLYFSNNYILKAEILNSLGRYQEAYVQIQQLYDTHKLVTKEHCEVFGRIFTQMARSELGLGEINKALEHAKKAIIIFLADEKRNPKNTTYLIDPDLAASYVVQGDILFALNKLEEAITSYRQAYGIYFYLYKDRRKNVAYTSYLYLQGAKAACKKQDFRIYKDFGKSQVEEFGVDHPNTIAMFEYCKQYGMNLER
ncbi:tetratricopeptide repeat protein [Candidatus Tisiphia endosymbiont of Melanophora roralis]|uniref:tetratricopeptide repeat protein n=1 Tax=Candidatus Tisiphia endosymbiont of Melanophora roralis TaxID=3066261 RepID=UPI00312C78E4